MQQFDYLVIGGGLAGAEALAGVREVDPHGRIGLLSAERYRPYDRPPLSKALWKEGAEENAIWRSIPEDVELLLGRRAVTLDLKRHEVRDDGAATYRFGKLLLATGGTPRTLTRASDRVIYFRTLDDYRRLREATRQPRRVVVVGGGFIGTELAAALQWSGNEVTMLVPEQGLAARQFAPDLSAWLVEFYREKGVNVRLNQSAAEVTSRGRCVTIRTTGGDELVADVAVAGLGIVPNAGIAGAAGLEVENGIAVDEWLRTAHPDVYAAGDVASFPSPALGRRMRVEHEDNARTQGRVAGRNMAGHRARYDHMPFFYSDLYELGYEAVGELDARHQIVADWKQPFREGVLYYLSEERVRGVLLWNTWGQVDAARTLIAESGPVALEGLKRRLPEAT